MMRRRGGASTTIEDLLARSPPWAALPVAVRREIAARAARRRFRRGQRLLGLADRAVVVLVVGRADVIATGAGDDPVVVRSVGPPATIGVSVALGAPASAELWAAQDGELIAIPGEALAATFRRHP